MKYVISLILAMFIMIGSVMAQEKPLRVVVATHNASVWPLYILEKHKWFGYINKPVQVMQVTDFNLHLMGIMNEEFDITIHGTTPAVLMLASKGLPLKLIRPLITPFHGSLIATEEFASLKGKRVSYAATNPEQIVYLRPYLKAQGLTENDINTININGTTIRFQTLMTKQVDATILNPPFDVMATSKGMVTLSRLGKYSPHSPWAFITTNQKFVDNNTELVKNFSKAYDVAVNYFYDPINRKEMIDLLMALVKGNEMTREQVTETYQTFIKEKYFKTGPFISKSGFDLALNELVALKTINNTINFETMMIPHVSMLVK